MKTLDIRFRMISAATRRFYTVKENMHAITCMVFCLEMPVRLLSSARKHLTTAFCLILFYRRRTEQVNGLPIIFVPGNAGSSKQVRSLGSVLHNKTESRNLPFTFDVFAVDFNEVCCNTIHFSFQSI